MAESAGPRIHRYKETDTLPTPPVLLCAQLPAGQLHLGVTSDSVSPNSTSGLSPTCPLPETLWRKHKLPRLPWVILPHPLELTGLQILALPLTLQPLHQNPLPNETCPTLEFQCCSPLKASTVAPVTARVPSRAPARQPLAQLTEPCCPAHLCRVTGSGRPQARNTFFRSLPELQCHLPIQSRPSWGLPSTPVQPCLLPSRWPQPVAHS